MRRISIRRVVAAGATVALVGGLTSLAGASAAPAAAPDPGKPGPEPVQAPKWVTDGRVDPDRLSVKPGIRSFGPQQQGTGYEVGDTRLALVLDATTGAYSVQPFTVEAVGEHLEVWVQDDLSFPSGDARNPVEVTDAQIQYLVEEYDTNIYPKETDFWRTPKTRTGTDAQLDDVLGLPSNYYVPADGKARTVAFVMNVRDQQYYGNSQLYIAGFFSPTFAFYFNRNIITIDAYDWANRVGLPAEAPWSDGNPDNNRPNLYEGTFAHEYQHLLHGDQDADETTWVNEGLADWTEKLVGYGLPDSHVTSAQQLPENSLVQWEDQGPEEVLADYGLATTFLNYLNDRYGKAALQALFDSQSNGIAAVNEVLDQVGADLDFAELYHEFALARLIDGGRTGGPTKGYYRLADVDVPLRLFTDQGEPNPEAFATPGAPPWGSDYRVITDESVKKVRFDGLDELTKPTPWTSVSDPLASGQGQVLASGHADASDRWLIMGAQGGDTLTFDTLYNIENGWDLGALQVSTDGGQTWQSQSYALTVNDPSGMNPNALPRVTEQLPGVTGWSKSWQQASVDLSTYSGDLLVAFRYIGDPAASGNGVETAPGWYVDNVALNGEVVSDGSSTEPFQGITQVNPVELDFHVDVVGVSNEDGEGEARHKVFTMGIDDRTETSGAFAINKVLKDDGYAVLVITYDAPIGQTDYAPYDLELVRDG